VSGPVLSWAAGCPGPLARPHVVAEARTLPGGLQSRAGNGVRRCSRRGYLHRSCSGNAAGSKSGASAFPTSSCGRPGPIQHVRSHRLEQLNGPLLPPQARRSGWRVLPRQPRSNISSKNQGRCRSKWPHWQPNGRLRQLIAAPAQSLWPTPLLNGAIDNPQKHRRSPRFFWALSSCGSAPAGNLSHHPIPSRATG